MQIDLQAKGHNKIYTLRPGNTFYSVLQCLLFCRVASIYLLRRLKIATIILKNNVKTVFTCTTTNILKSMRCVTLMT